MKDEIRKLLGAALPGVDLDSDFLFAEVDSLGISTILYLLAQKYRILLEGDDVTPRNFKSVDSLAEMVQSKMTLESRIYQYSQSTPDKTAVVCGNDSISYSKFWKAIKDKKEELISEGLKSGRPYVFRATQDISFVVTYCAVHLAGAIAVPLEHKVPEESFNSIRDEVNSNVFPPDISDILYTTGTTGHSKGVMLSSKALWACADNFIEGMNFTQDLLFIVSGPLNHIASLFKIHPILSVGGTLCILDGLKDINAFFDVFNLPYGKFATFMVPASLRMIMQFSYKKLCATAPKVEFIETGAAPITRSDMEQLSRALPGSRLYNTYGGTEIGCVCAYNFNDGIHKEGCVGTPLKNTSVEVTPEGNVIVSGLTIMSGYVGDEAMSSQIMPDGRIHCSDLGYIDEAGMLHLTGRQGDVINVGGYKVNPLEVENAASEFPGIKECICIAGSHPVIGTTLKLLVVPSEGHIDSAELAKFLQTSLEPFKVPTEYQEVEKLERTYNGKLDRKFYFPEKK